MTDLTKTIAAKSDQLNADDLIGGSITVRITKVSAVNGEQPIAINYEGDNGKPFMPCKSMRRVLVGVWGGDGNKYIGRSLTLYRDPSVTFGGMAVGGIRISHVSHIDRPVTLSLTATKKSKKPFTINPLAAAQSSSSSADDRGGKVEDKPVDHEALMVQATGAAKQGTAQFREYWKKLTTPEREVLRPYLDILKHTAEASDDPFAAGNPESEVAAQNHHAASSSVADGESLGLEA